MKYLSTSALAKQHDLPSKQLFEVIHEKGWIVRSGGGWELTQDGERVGGKYQESAKFGKYITWPESISAKLGYRVTSESAGKMITAKIIGKHYELSAIKVNHVLSELGWVNKALKGWKVTEQGKRLGALQAEDAKSGIPFVRWPEVILKTKVLADTVSQLKGTSSPKDTNERIETDEVGFREKFQAKHRSTDGHFVRSKAEMLIDNWLYMAEIVHAYERKLPIEEDVYSDFYIPTGKVYIEYWGLEEQPKYLVRKQKKQEIYQKYGFNLIELNDQDVLNLDDILPRLLLKYGVQAY